MHNIWSSGSHSRLLEHWLFGFGKKAMMMIGRRSRMIARSTVDRSFASVSLTQIQHLLDENHVWKFCFHPVHLWVVLRYHRAHRRSLENKKSYISTQTLIFKLAIRNRKSLEKKMVRLYHPSENFANDLRKFSKKHTNWQLNFLKNWVSCCKICQVT